MLFPLVVDEAVWYGPAMATFAVQFAGDPMDPARNDVRVRFVGDKNQREERAAYFDSTIGVWRATLYSKTSGSYHAVLVRNGIESTLESQEGIVTLQRSDAGILPAKSDRTDREALDTGDVWAGIGVDLGEQPTAAKVSALAAAGANWVRLALPSGEPPADWNDAMTAIERRGLFYTLALSKDADDVWRRYAVDRFSASPRLVQWEASGDVADPWGRATHSTAVTWDGLFEGRPGPFIVKDGDFSRIKALHSLLDVSDWSLWKSPRTWKVDGAKGVGETDRMIFVASPGAKLDGVPLADGAYDLTSIDPLTDVSKSGLAQVLHGVITVDIPAERFFALRRHF